MNSETAASLLEEFIGYELSETVTVELIAAVTAAAGEPAFRPYIDRLTRRCVAGAAEWLISAADGDGRLLGPALTVSARRIWKKATPCERALERILRVVVASRAFGPAFQSLASTNWREAARWIETWFYTRPRPLPARFARRLIYIGDRAELRRRRTNRS